MFKVNRIRFGALTLSAVTSAMRVSTQVTSVGVKNVVLVHGAFADGSSSAKIIPLLKAKGLNVVSVQNSLTSLADDVPMLSHPAKVVTSTAEAAGKVTPNNHN